VDVRSYTAQTIGERYIHVAMVVLGKIRLTLNLCGYVWMRCPKVMHALSRGKRLDLGIFAKLLKFEIGLAAERYLPHPLPLVRVRSAIVGQFSA